MAAVLRSLKLSPPVTKQRVLHGNEDEGYARENPEMGYTQGMCFLAAIACASGGLADCIPNCPAWMKQNTRSRRERKRTCTPPSERLPLCSPGVTSGERRHERQRDRERERERERERKERERERERKEREREREKRERERVCVCVCVHFVVHMRLPHW